MRRLVDEEHPPGRRSALAPPRAASASRGSRRRPVSALPSSNPTASSTSCARRVAARRRSLEPAEEDEILQARDPRVERAIARRHRPDAGTKRPPAAAPGRNRPRGRGRVGLVSPVRTRRCGACRRRSAPGAHGSVMPDDEGRPARRPGRSCVRRRGRSTSSGAVWAGWTPAVAGTCSLEMGRGHAQPTVQKGWVSCRPRTPWSTSQSEVAPRRPRRDRSPHGVDGGRRNAESRLEVSGGAARSGEEAGLSHLHRCRHAPRAGTPRPDAARPAAALATPAGPGARGISEGRVRGEGHAGAQVGFEERGHAVRPAGRGRCGGHDKLEYELSPSAARG